jgi:hypothetical protein
MVSATAMLRVGAQGLLLLQQCIGMSGDERFLMQAEAQPVRKEADCPSHALGLRLAIEDAWGGDPTTAAVNHLAASRRADHTEMSSGGLYRSKRLTRSRA